VLDRSREDGGVHKCTLCYDRQKDGMTPACAQACPTASIQFGPLETLRDTARQRVRELHSRGEDDAYLYGAESTPEYGALHSIFLLKDHPNVYNLPEAPQRPVAQLRRNYLMSFAAAVGVAVASAFVFGRK
jgi:formate dehydrogenase iron-sulfur subunit